MAIFCAGDATLPIHLSGSLRDGGSFTTRRVQAIQKGKPIHLIALPGDEEGYCTRGNARCAGREELRNETQYRTSRPDQ